MLSILNEYSNDEYELRLHGLFLFFRNEKERKKTHEHANTYTGMLGIASPMCTALHFIYMGTKTEIHHIMLHEYI